MLIQKRSIAQLSPWCHSVLNMINAPDGVARVLLGAHAHQFEDVHNALTAAREEVERLSAIRATAVKASEAALRNLARFCGDARMFVTRRMVRENAPQLVQTRFNAVGERPKSQTSKYWIPLTRDLLAAEAHAHELGHPMMVYPTVDEVREALNAAQAARDAVKNADFLHRQAADDLRAVNNRLIVLWEDTVAWFRYSLRRKSKPAQRAIMRRFEFEFADGAAEGPPTSGGEPMGTGDPTPGNGGGTGGGSEPTTEDPTQGTEPPANEEPEPSTAEEPSSGSTQQSTPDSSSTQPSSDSGSTQQPGSDSGSTSQPSTGGQPTGSDRDADKPADSTQTPPIVSTDQGGLDNGRG